MDYDQGKWIPREQREHPEHREERKTERPANQNGTSYENSLRQMERAWMKKEKYFIVQYLKAAFLSLPAEDHHNYVYYLIDRGEDFRCKKYESLALIILKEFEKVVKQNEKFYEELVGRLPESYKLAVFQLATMGHSNFLPIICKVFGLTGPGNHYLKSHVDVMLVRHQYKEACLCVTALRLQRLFPLESIVLPLVFQDKVNLVEPYVKPYRDLQQELVQTLDGYCVKGFDLQSYIDSLRVSGARLEKLRPKNLSKLIVRLVKLFQLDMSACPNTLQIKELGSMRYLLYKKYVDKSMSDVTWNELMITTVGTDEYLQKELVDLLMSYNDAPSAARFAERFNLASDSLHPVIQDAMQNLALEGEKRLANCEECWDNDDGIAEDDERKYYDCQLTDDCIHVVDTISKLQSCMQAITQHEGAVIGMDMEWKPSLSVKQSAVRISVVQLALADRAFLLDMPALGADGNRRSVEEFFDALLISPETIKLGYGADTDFAMLQKSYPFLRTSIDHRRSFVDLSAVQETVDRSFPGLFRHRRGDDADGAGNEKGLSELVFLCFGRPLNKMEQMSNWELRPLRKAQIRYAALDAFCLLDIYHHINELLTDNKLNVDVYSLAINGGSRASSSVAEKVKRGKKATRAQREKQKAEAFKKAMDKVVQCERTAISARDFRVVCDNMLQGLGRYLRSCGVDVKILKNSDDHDVAARIAREENRMILTSGLPYNTLKSHVQEGCCMDVRNTLKARDQVEDVLRFFNVKVSSTDIFSRCQVCNGDSYVEVKQADMRRLWLEAHWNSRRRGGGADARPSGPPAQEQEEATATLPFHLPRSACSDRRNLPPPLLDEEDDEGVEGFTASDDCPYVQGLTYVGPATGVATGVATPSLPSSRDHRSKSLDEGGSDGDVRFYEPTLLRRDLAVDFERGTFVDGSAIIGVGSIPEGVLNGVRRFYVCSTCGKVYWAGGHHRHITEQFGHFLTDD